MPNELRVETGNGLSDSDSYVSLEDASSFLSAYSTAEEWDLSDEDARRNALRQATEFIDELFTGRWRGHIANHSQALSWPRFGVEDDDCRFYGSSQIPVKLQKATARVAVFALGGDLLGGSTPADGEEDDSTQYARIKSESVTLGPIKESFTYKDDDDDSAAPEGPREEAAAAAESTLRGLYTGGNTGYAGVATRH